MVLKGSWQQSPSWFGLQDGCIRFPNWNLSKSSCLAWLTGLFFVFSTLSTIWFWFWVTSDDTSVRAPVYRSHVFSKTKHHYITDGWRMRQKSCNQTWKVPFQSQLWAQTEHTGRNCCFSSSVWRSNGWETWWTWPPLLPPPLLQLCSHGRPMFICCTSALCSAASMESWVLAEKKTWLYLLNQRGRLDFTQIK